jgi:murein DD-endopeptidase MepM/ murein hydrolase activator NlpD/cell division protein ZapA (FtsZ GTPase activity inhibitor)
MLEIVLKSVLITTVIYIFYRLFLQRETFFQSIRVYFIIGILASFILPLIIIPIYIEYEPIITKEIINDSFPILENIPKKEAIANFETIKEPFNWMLLISRLYVIGILIFLIKLSIELLSLMSLIYKSKKRKVGKYTFVETKKELSPFSFFNYIVCNKSQFNSDELKDIITHEEVHVLQKHSLDILLIQLLVIMQWFNPFVWLYKKDTQQNLEYIADKVAQEKSNTKKTYQYLLLKTSITTNPFALSNNFFNSHLKKRIMMLQKSQTKRLNQLKYVLLLPLIAVFLYAFNTKKVYVPKEDTYSFKSIEKNKSDSIIQFKSPIPKEKLTRLSSNFGLRIHPITKEPKFHNGVDIVAKKGTDVHATADGVVIKAEFDTKKGHYIQIQHANHFQTNFHHLEKIKVSVGDKVNVGDVIATVGNSGASVGSHLHYEIQKNGKHMNPVKYLDYSNVDLERRNIYKINSHSTDDYINNITAKFNQMYKPVKIRFSNITRNAIGNITGFVIETKLKESHKFVKNISSNSKNEIKDFTFEYLKSTDEIILKMLNKGRFVEISINENGSKTIMHTVKPTPIFKKNKFKFTITKTSSDKDLEKIKTDLKSKNITINYEELKRNADNEIINIKLNVKNNLSQVNMSANNNSGISNVTIFIDGDSIAVSKGNSDNIYISNQVNASVSTDNHGKKQYLVKKGDTFYSIAKIHNISVEELHQLNSGIKNNLIVGLYLFVSKKAKDKHKEKTNAVSSYTNNFRTDSTVSINGQVNTNQANNFVGVGNSNAYSYSIDDNQDSETTYTVNGKIVSKETLNNLDPKKIAEVSVYRDKNRVDVQLKNGKYKHYSTISKRIAVSVIKVENRHQAKFYYGNNEISYKEALKLVRKKYQNLDIIKNMETNIVNIRDK